MLSCNMKSAIIVLVVTLHLCMVTSSSSESRARHKRAWIIDSFTIEEENPGPFPYRLGKVHVDRDYRVKFKLLGDGVDEEPVGVLQIDENTGVISVLGKVDFEKHRVLKLKFEARNVSNEKLDTRLGVEISILDVNDQAPTFQKQVYEVTIDESQQQGTNVLTVRATDFDRPGTLNATVEYKILSVTPITSDAEFFIEETGRISFKGCLDYEKANKYTIVVEAKDRGEKVQLSSSSTVIVNVLDKNNYLPVFNGVTGLGRVKERESGMSPLRIHVTDKDTKGTAAWRVRYTIKGDNQGNFEIQTDPETNDGILTVVKPLDYELASVKQLSITAENEDPYFSCELKRKTSGALWKVINIDADPGKGGVPVFVSSNVTILVEDINDPPEFTFSAHEVVVDEDASIGHYLETFTASDPDGKSPNDFEYIKGDDPDNWVSVDPKTGAITTVNALDRESPYVVNGTYLITLYAIDKGEPPMTATATLTLHVTDKNDNLPQLQSNTISMCLSDDATMTNISAYDLDDAPYSGPFRFELVGEDKDKWSLDTNYGTTVNLIKKSTVYAGFYELQLKVYDQQERFSVQNITVAACDCSISQDCSARAAASKTQINSSAIGIVFAALLLLLGILLLGLLLTCGREKIEFPFSSDSGDVLLSSNIETPGTDCKIPETPQLIKQDQSKTATQAAQGLHGQNGTLIQSSNQQAAISNQQVGAQWYNYREAYESSQGQSYNQHHSNAVYKTMSLQRSLSRNERYKSLQTSTLSGHHSASSRGGALFLKKEALTSLVSQRLSSIQAFEEELCDYDPKVYTCEEDSVVNPELDSISVDEGSFVPDDLLYLGPRFQTLATICSPTPTQP
ncbi:cadherin-like protein 26 isoform X1 [Anguilla anguilla]|uniref:cadherin-like protein 26 isoform X1 n=1 Tax=Anguilla anguilla TaxID=7936 RepID=UPI0015AA0399|nr:cadherin-like protein 26 isoform X1 [Anguilla anguilla]